MALPTFSPVDELPLQPLAWWPYWPQSKQIWCSPSYSTHRGTPSTFTLGRRALGEINFDIDPSIPSTGARHCRFLYFDYLTNYSSYAHDLFLTVKLHRDPQWTYPYYGRRDGGPQSKVRFAFSHH